MKDVNLHYEISTIDEIPEIRCAYCGGVIYPHIVSANRFNRDMVKDDEGNLYHPWCGKWKEVSKCE